MIRRFIRKLQPAVPRAREGVVILAYHLVAGGTASPVDLPLATFEGHLRFFAASGRVVSLAEAAARLARRERCPGPLFVLTFDDAFRNFRERVFPRLVEQRLPATLFAPVDFVEGKSRAPLAGAEDLPACTFAELREMQASGWVTVGSHTESHPDLPALDDEALRRELAGSRQRLEAALERPVKEFCYPRAAHSARVVAEVGRHYSTAVVAGGRVNRPRRCHPLRLSRLPLRRDQPADLGRLTERRVWLEEAAAALARRMV